MIIYLRLKNKINNFILIHDNILMIKYYYNKKINSKEQRIIKVSFLICIILIIKEYILNIRNINKGKICLCVLGKNENLYIKEFIEYYKKYGVDKIFLYDNNDKDGERFEEILSQYIDNKFVEI